MNGYLVTMLFIWAFGVLLIRLENIETKNKRAIRIAFIVWSVIWAIPPMAHIWINGVML